LLKKELTLTKKKDLTEKQFIFCMEYLTDFNATRAAIKAGYSKKTADSQGSRMLKNVKVKSFIDNQTTKRVEKLEVTKESVIKELAKIAFHDIRKMYDEKGFLIPVYNLDDDTAAVISSFKSRREFQGKGEDGKAEYDIVDEYKRHDKVKTLELLGKHLGMFSDKPKEDDEDSTTKTKRVQIVRRNRND
jgi:phage terminase small subunit